MHSQGWKRGLAEGRQNHLLQTCKLEEDIRKDKGREVKPIQAHFNCVGERGTPPAEQWDDTKPGWTEEVLSSFS